MAGAARDPESPPRVARRRGTAAPRSDAAAGEIVAGVGGAALLLLMPFEWFGGANAFQLRLADLLLVALALLALALAAAPATGRRQLAPAVAAVVLVVTGGVALGIMLSLVLESSGGTVPLVVGMLASGGILGGGLIELRPGG